MIKFDYHTHSSHSCDCVSSMDDMIKTAIKLGLEEYAITDHVDFSWPDNKIISPYGIAANMKAMQAAAAKYDGRIKVLAGVELSLRPDSARIAQKIADSYDFDIIIGSAHDVKGIDFGWPEFYRGRTKHEFHMAYFENLLDVVCTCDAYDVIGHFDYAERYGNYSDKTLFYPDFCDIIDEILKIVIAKGKGIEINTAGFAYGIGHAHPQTEILRRYLQLGGEIITVGSDAHTPGRIAADFDIVHDILQGLGIKYIAGFNKRQPRLVRI